MPTSKMPIMEVFGPTIQGEGMVIGRKTMFVRTGGCDYKCNWCDSAFTWNGTEKATMMSAGALYEQLQHLAAGNFNHVTISGGNPALIGDAMGEFIDLCQQNGIAIGLETQGSKWQNWMWKVNDLTISPKPPSSGMDTDWDVLDEIISYLRPLALREHTFSLKVVIFDDADYEYARRLHAKYPDVAFYLSVGNVNASEPGDISGRLLSSLDWLWSKVLADPAMNNARPLPQLHTLVWANRRGV